VTRWLVILFRPCLRCQITLKLNFIKQIPPVFDGKHFIVYALLADDAHQPKWAEVIAASPVGPLSLKVHLNEQNSEEGQLVHW
jgi:hypothetical protein